MKTISVIFLGFALIGVLLLVHINKQEQISVPDSVSIEFEQKAVDIEANDSFQEASQSRKTPEKTKIWVVDEKKLQAEKKKITELIEEFDRNLDNLEKREELKVRLSQISEIYKQEVLAKVKSTIHDQNNWI